jgi:glycosyltransferase involved in cell wall biosynthesis
MKNSINNLSVVIITKNEEKFISDAIKSALFADEVLILDSGSTDDTCKKAQDLGAKVYQEEWLGFGAQKNAAIEKAVNEWVFVLDSDERIPTELQNEILKTLEKPDFKGYYVARLNNYWGKYIKTCGLYPDYSLRLFNKNAGRFKEVAVHESVQLNSPTSCLNNHMVHLAYDSIDEFIEKQNRYSTLSKKERNKIKALINPYWTFFKLFFIKKGFLDGWDGFIISKLYAQYTFWKYIK